MIEQVYLDLDGVLVDFVAAVLEDCGAKEKYLTPGEYNLEVSLGIDLKKMLTNWSWKTWAEIPPTKEMEDILEMIHTFYPKENVIVCTKIFKGKSAHGKTVWLNKHMKDYAYTLTNNKCRLANEHALLIDDSDDEINKFIGSGGQGILIPRIWNSKYKSEIPLLKHLKEGLRKSRGYQYDPS